LGILSCALLRQAPPTTEQKSGWPTVYCKVEKITKKEIKTMENLNKVVKEIKIISKLSKKGGKNNFVKVELINGNTTEIWCEREVAELIQACRELNIEPIKSFTLEKRISEKTGASYNAIVLKMFNDDEYFYFLPRATNTIAELLYKKETEGQN